MADVLDESKMGRGEALFAKALEQVQGDERDIIIFSVAFSKQANGKVPTKFGPLTNAGGERRLNVAVTRARRKNIVFCSFDPSTNELDVSGSTYQGPKDFKQFLVDAKAAGSQSETAEPAHRIAIRDRHRDDIAAALRAAGLHVMSDVGLSNFRLDLVLARPASPSRPILPVLLDGESWKKRNTVSDRDVLPVEVLENLMGWPTVARIWWPMWLQNRQEVIDGIVAAVDRAEAWLDGKTIEPEVAAPEVTPDARLAVRIGEPPPPPESGTAASYAAASVVETNSHQDDQATQDEPDHTTPEPVMPTAKPVVEDAIHDGSPVEEALIRDPPAPAPPVASTPADVGGGHAAESDADPVSEFVPSHANVVGPKGVLDALPDREAAATIREQVIDVIESEGPIESARLARIVARRFGLKAVRASRAEDIIKLIPRGQLRKSRLGSFAWPASLDPATWTGFRVVDPDGSRSLEEVAPEEIANAMSAVLVEHPESSDEDVLRRTAELFGILRLGANVRTRLESVYKKLPAEPPAAAAPSVVGAPSNEMPAVAIDVRPSGVAAGRSQPPESATASSITVQVPGVRPPDAVVDEFARAAESIRPDLSRVDDYLYYDYSRDRQLSADLKELVNELVLDPGYDGRPDSAIAAARTDHLPTEDASSVGYSASMVWGETVGKELDRTVKNLVAHLAADPDFEPLPWNEEIDNFVASRLSGKRPGLVALVQRELNQFAFENGLIAKLEIEIKREARAALDGLTPLDRDVYGFTSRNAKRLQLAQPYIAHVRESRRRFVVYWMSRLEGEEFGLEREARYATAVRALLAQSESRAAISRTLGISTSIMDRIERENRRDVVLAMDDPILTDLAPSLR